MESSRYLCAIKVLYTGRATFESRVLTGHRFRGRPKRSILRGSCPFSFYLSLSLFLSCSFISYTSLLVRSLSDIRFFLSFMSGEVTDLLTIAGDERTSGKRRGGRRRDEEDQTRDFVGSNRRHSILYTSLHRTFECSTLDLK